MRCRRTSCWRCVRPAARVVTLERNYRSTQPLLDACNAVIDQAHERFRKRLYTTKASRQKPRLVTAEDELAQVDYVVEHILAAREDGLAALFLVGNPALGSGRVDVSPV